MDLTKPSSSRHRDGQVTARKCSSRVSLSYSIREETARIQDSLSYIESAGYPGSPVMRLLGSSSAGVPSQETRSSQETARKEFICQTCGYQAISESKLTMHIRRHTGEKPFNCPFCPYRSAQKSNLSTHIKNVHHLNPVDGKISSLVDHTENCSN